MDAVNARWSFIRLFPAVLLMDPRKAAVFLFGAAAPAGAGGRPRSLIQAWNARRNAFRASSMGAPASRARENASFAFFSLAILLGLNQYKKSRQKIEAWRGAIGHAE